MKIIIVVILLIIIIVLLLLIIIAHFLKHLFPKNIRACILVLILKSGHNDIQKNFELNVAINVVFKL